MYQYFYTLLFSVASLYLVWRYAKLSQLSVVKWFDVITSSAILSLLISRLGYIFLHWSNYSDLAWSWFPYYTQITDRVWFQSYPWIYLKFYEGFSPMVSFIVIVLAISIFVVKQQEIDKLREWGMLIMFSILFNLGILIYRFSEFWITDGDISLVLSLVVVTEILVSIGLVYAYLQNKILDDHDFFYRLVVGFLAIGLMNIFYPIKSTLGYNEDKIAVTLGVIFILSSLIIIARKKFEISSTTRDRVNKITSINKVGEFLVKKDVNMRRDTTRGFMLSYKSMRKNDNKIKQFLNFVLTTYYKILHKRNKDEGISKQRK